MWNAGLNEAEAGVKSARRNINNLRYTDDTTLWQKVKKNQRASWWKRRVSEKAGLKLNIQKTKIVVSRPITSWQIDGETRETVTNFIFLDSKITADGDCDHEIKRHLLFGKKVKVAQSCPTLCNPMDCIVHGLLQARILEPFLPESSPGWSRVFKGETASATYSNVN